MTIAYLDLKDSIYGRLLVIKKTDKTKHGWKWECVCECGKVVNVLQGNLRSGHTKSCGCYKIDINLTANTKYGVDQHRANHIWHGMKDRCLNIDSKFYYRYGGRGITICNRWLFSFENFWEDMKNTYKPNLSIDRINNDGNYEPSNCKWSTQKQQANNQSNNRIFTINNETMNLKQFTEKYKNNYKKVHLRIQRGWSVEKALFTN